MTSPPARLRWSADDIRRARQRPLAPLLEAQGLRLHRLEDGNFRLLGESEELIVKDNYWIRPATGQVGNAIDFFVKIRGMRFDSVMRLLLPG